MNGTGNTLISGVIRYSRLTLTKDDSGTLTLTGTNIYTRGNNRERRDPSREQHSWFRHWHRSRNGQQRWHYPWRNRHNRRRGTVNAGANIAPGNGGNNTGILPQAPLTLASNSNFRVDINGTTPGSGYDQLNTRWGQVELRLAEAILWSQSARHYRSGRHLPF